MAGPLPRCALLVTVAVLALATVGCHGGDDDKRIDDTARQISDDELAEMVLALTDFGAGYAGFQAEDNGLRTIDQIVAGDLDPDDERADLERFGWASAYEEFYANPQADNETSGVLAVGSTVNLFDTAQGADGYLEDSKEELTTQVGMSTGAVTIADIQKFDAAVADEAVGAIVKGDVKTEQTPRTQLWQIAIIFRHGRLVAVVTMYSSEEPQSQDTVNDLAVLFDENISAVLASAPAED